MCKITTRVKSQFRHPAPSSIPESWELPRTSAPKDPQNQDFHGKQSPKKWNLAVVAMRNGELRAWLALSSFCCALAQEHRGPELPFQHPSVSPRSARIPRTEPGSLLRPSQQKGLQKARGKQRKGSSRNRSQKIRFPTGFGEGTFQMLRWSWERSHLPLQASAGVESLGRRRRKGHSQPNSGSVRTLRAPRCLSARDGEP